MTTTKASHGEPLSETEALRIELEQTRAHLADTVQELSRQLNVPRRIKDSAAQAGRRLQGRAQQVPTQVKAVPSRMKTVPGRMKELSPRVKDVPARVKEMPAAGRRHPKATAAVGGAVALTAGAAAWLLRRNR
ncbi:DUF3618 domain-containing protein [Kribbella sp. CA-247076]|uniref:DUF3618 domain-containing protein n=1 Tax=Kribbella sp. CA-247076 TaxID=3239941 RepID=UPI003D8DDB89